MVVGRTQAKKGVRLLSNQFVNNVNLIGKSAVLASLVGLTPKFMDVANAVGAYDILNNHFRADHLLLFLDFRVANKTSPSVSNLRFLDVNARQGVTSEVLP